MGDATVTLNACLALVEPHLSESARTLALETREEKLLAQLLQVFLLRKTANTKPVTHLRAQQRRRIA